jgi:hypothetical protein
MIDPEAADDTATVRSIVLVAFTANVEALVQLTTLAAAAHDHPEPVAETYVSPSGRSSVITIPVGATEGPLLFTASV